MGDPLRPVAPVVELINARITPPAFGSRVLALSKGGVLVPTVWTSSSSFHFIGWCAYPKIPQDVKDMMMEQYT